MRNLLTSISLAALVLAMPMSTNAQTNPDPWYDVFNGPHAQTLAILAQHANASIFDPDFKAKIEALGPSVQIVDVPIGQNFFYDNFSYNVANDSYFYQRGSSYGLNQPIHAFGSGPLAQWQAVNGSNAPVVLNVDGNGPLGVLDPRNPGFFGLFEQDGYDWPYNPNDASDANGKGHYAANLGANSFTVPIKMYATFASQISGKVRVSSKWTAHRLSINATGTVFNEYGYSGTPISHGVLPQQHQVYATVRETTSGGILGTAVGKLNQNYSSAGKPNWLEYEYDFIAVKGKTYAIEISLSDFNPATVNQGGPFMAVDDVRVFSGESTYKTVANPFYKPPNTGPTIGSLDLSNVTELQYTGFVRPLPFDPSTTIYFPPTDPQIGPGPCCGPFSEEKIPELLTPTFPNGGAGDFTMAYTPSATFDAQMAAYLNYVHAQDASITEISVNYSMASLGTGTSAASYGPFVTTAPNKTVTWTWTPGGVTNNGGTFWSGSPFSIGTWYGVMTTISHNGTVNSPHFNANCAQNWWRFRAQGTMRLGRPTSNVVSLEAIGANNSTTRAAPRPILAGERIRVRNVDIPAAQRR